MARTIVNVSYALTQHPTPVFNTPELASCFGGNNGDTIPLDEQGLMRTVETVLFPETTIRLLKQVAHSHIWKISPDEYPYEGDFFIDDRFVRTVAGPSPQRQIQLPSITEILKIMRKLENTRYIWGGNWPGGIDILPILYPSRTDLAKLDPLVQDTWRLKGLDCSGLLHYASNGWTPRNTSSLVHFGAPIDIEKQDAARILKKLQPLDMIAWEGHVVCILDEHTTIESKPTYGVVRLNSFDRLSEIMKERKAVNQWDAADEPRFVIRRWHPNNNC